MHFVSSTAAVLLHALSVSATWSAYQEFLSLHKKDNTQDYDRPDITYSPQQPYEPIPVSPARTRTCVVKSHNDFKTDDSPYILDAIKSCNNGGHVLFPRNQTYVIGTALDLSWLCEIDLEIQGYIQFSNDTDYWQKHGFYQTFQNATTFFQLGGTDVNVYGHGMFDGNGQGWYDLYASDEYILRPILFGVVGLHGGLIADLYLRYSPQWYNFLANSSDVVYDNIDISGYSTSKNLAKNTDGWDTYRSKNVVIQNSVINNGDDCIAFKPNATEHVVQNLYCNGSHGVSVGSLGQYKEETDIVENIYVSEPPSPPVTNVHLSNSTNGLRIKVWPGSAAALSGDLQGGGGTGRVNNITYKDITVDDVDYAIQITQCYGQKNLTLCDAFPSSLEITNILFDNVRGDTTKKYEPISGYVVCSSEKKCSNIQMDNINVESPDGTKNQFTCGKVDQSLLHGIQCTTINKGAS
ncbi:PGX, glycoside hydrolase family 28 protein [Teratosphaeria destructans]|uniref:galacturonan 1,4-alpha-galacturonidase n=1 Tax=Teratosphaeria destructans TaxID=418781 RepID=A0A9W7SWS0_9PEZI|nr:PGX, glycoside hydrolase family 28 protein [Teratosphaeria destructans]